MWPFEVGVGGHLPAGEVDRLQAGLDHLHGLAAGHRPERGDARLGAEQRPEPLGSEAGERVLDPHRAAEALDVVGRVRPVDPVPAVGPRPVSVRAHLRASLPGQSLSWSRSQDSGQVHSATAAVGSDVPRRRQASSVDTD